MAQTIKSTVATGIGLADPDVPGSGCPRSESSSVLDLRNLVGDLSDAISVVTRGLPVSRRIRESHGRQ
jgi:hypothetical protein